MLLFLFACTHEPEPLNGVPRIEVSLPMKWVAGTDPVGTTSFQIERETQGHLFLDGIWYGAEITLDGKALPTVKLAHAPMVVDLPVLSAGTHQLSLTLIRPDAQEPKAQSLANRNWRQRAGIVELWLGASSIRVLGLPMKDGKIAPVVEVAEGVPAGSTVEVVISRDGQVEASWDAIEANTAFPPQTWKGARWDIGEPELWTGTAILKDSGGAVIDVFSQRVGFWEVGLDGARLSLNGHAAPLLALRANPLATAGQLVSAMPESGGNAVEIHGEVPDGKWLSYFDEWGVPVVHMPRCDGGLWDTSIGDNNGRKLWESLAPVLTDQDRRLLQASLGRPSVLAWACEGSTSLRDAMCGRLQKDPLGRPVLGLDNFALSIIGLETTQFEHPAWVIEIGSNENFKDFALVGRSFLRATGAEGPGGVYFPPPPRDRAAWAAAWLETSQKLGVRPWSSKKRRAMSALLVGGLQVGEIVYLEPTWQSGVGAAANDQGFARIETWFVGEATLVVGGVRRSVTLVADEWDGTSRVDRAVTVGR